MTDIERMTQERAQAQQELAPLTPAQRSQIRERLKMTMIEAAVLAAKAGWV